jgi:predicted N-acetyltransferase YhbS
MMLLMGARSGALTDWSTADQDALAALYGRERDWWADHLDWDTGESWHQVETARSAGRLPGVAVVNANGGVDALGYCFLDDGIAQLAVSTTACEAHEALVTHALLERAAAEGATAASIFAPAPRAVAAHGPLARAGFEIERYQYLVRDLAAGDGHAVASAGWREADAADAARLLQAAYGEGGRHFAAHGRLDQWMRYVDSVVSFTGCGRFAAAASRIWRDGAHVLGVAMVTTISPGVAHLAQLAVHPTVRGRGIAGCLLDDAMQTAAAFGCRRMTLLVDDASPAATRLYATRGFAMRERFAAAWLELSRP